MRGQWRRLAIAAVISLAVAGGAACSTKILLQTTVPTGTWGGQGAQLVVAPSSSTIQFDCAHGTLDSPIQLDRNGRFDVSGFFVQEHGGPVQAGGAEDRHGARFSGSTDGARLTLSITVADLNLDLGPFLVVRGATAHLTRCV